MQSDSSNPRGISFDRVRAAVEKLTADGRPISAGTIREALGDTGSKTTILKHLTALREQQGPPGHVDSGGLSEQLIHLLAKEVARVAGERTAQLNERLEEARSTIRSLISENESLSDELASSTSALEGAQRSLAERSGVESELRSQLTHMSEIERELAIARQQLVGAQAERVSLEERLKDARAALARSEASMQQLLQRVLDTPGVTGASRVAPREVS